MRSHKESDNKRKRMSVGICLLRLHRFAEVRTEHLELVGGGIPGCSRCSEEHSWNAIGAVRCR